MVKIKNAWFGLPIDEHDGQNDIMLEVSLDNGQYIWIPLRDRISGKHFSCFSGDIDKAIKLRPQTDGTSVYWENGPRLSFDEIIGMVEA